MPKRISSFSHRQTAKVGVLIANTGTPAGPTKKALRPYLKQFLSDPRIVDLPRWLWWLILNGIILNTRPKRSAKAYARVWTEHGSPLAVYTEAQAAALKKKLESSWGDRLVVDWAMRYGKPSIGERLLKMQEQGVEKLLVLPLYPQYASATTASIFDAVADFFKQQLWLPEIRFVTQYFDRPEYINAIAESIRNHWQTHQQAEKLIFSYHGEPLRYLHKGDPYHCQCLKTTRLVAEELELTEAQYLTTFQSRFGPGEWLRPYTSETLQSLPAQGVSRVQILCPGFAADCLETVDEIATENKEYFIKAGGKEFQYIPALNASSMHIDALSSVIEDELSSWTNLKKQDRSLTESIYDHCELNKQI